MLGAFPPSGRVLLRPERVDVDEAGGVGRLVVPLHVHAVERKALSLPWGNWGCPLGREKIWGDPDLAALSCCCPPHRPGGCGGLRTGSLPAPGEGSHGSGAAMPRPCQRHSPKFPSLVPPHSSSPCSGTAHRCSPCSRVILQGWLSYGRL